MSEIDARDSDDVTLTFTISSDASPGSSSGIIINLNSESSYSRSEVLELVIGEPQIIFFDDFENGIDNWHAKWGLGTYRKCL